MMDIISHSQLWLIIGFLMLVIEMFSLSFFAFFIAMGALLTALLTYFGILPTFALQVIVACVSSVVFLLLLRKVLKQKFSQPKSGVDYNEFKGEKVKVVREIPQNGSGRVLYRGAEWEAVSNDGSSIPENTIVTIVKMDGIIVVVER